MAQPYGTGSLSNSARRWPASSPGRIDPEHVVGVHVTQIFSFPSGDPAEMADLTEEEQGELETLTWFYENKLSFLYTGPWPPYNFVNIRLKLERAER